MGYGYGPGIGVSYYNSAYSVYAAPGATFYGGGAIRVPGAAGYGYAVPGWGDTASETPPWASPGITGSSPPAPSRECPGRTRV